VSELRMHEESQTVRRFRSGIPAYLEEHVMLARRWMWDPKLSGKMRKVFYGWHAREVLRKAWHELLAWDVAQCAMTMRNAFRTDPVWLWRARTAFAAHRLRQRGSIRK